MDSRHHSDRGRHTNNVYKQVCEHCMRGESSKENMKAKTWDFVNEYEY